MSYPIEPPPERWSLQSLNFPPGYRFSPKDHELIIDYLQKKVNNEVLPHNGIKSVDLYKYSPEDLTGRIPALGEKRWYFFTPRDRKYPNGDRPNRAAGDGYWKATGKDKPVTFGKKVVGHKKALVFYRGKGLEKRNKTNWIMHEFRVEGPRRVKKSQNDMKLDDWVLCSIYKKEKKSEAQEHVVPEKEEEVVGDQAQGNIVSAYNPQTPPGYEAARATPAAQHLDNKYFQEDDHLYAIPPEFEDYNWDNFDTDSFFVGSTSQSGGPDF